MRKFTEEELKKYDGRNGRRAYVACRGIIYDVTGSFLWKDGKHQVAHPAGRDLTVEIKTAPHGMDLLKKFPVVGRLER
jgi:predicted heme/steroid binding protein